MAYQAEGLGTLDIVELLGENQGLVGPIWTLYKEDIWVGLIEPRNPQEQLGVQTDTKYNIFGIT